LTRGCNQRVNEFVKVHVHVADNDHDNVKTL